MHDNYKKANASPRCVQTLAEDRRCTQPALRGRSFCRFHDPITTRNRRWDLPVIEDAPSLQIAITGVVNALVSGTLDRRAAELCLRGFRICAANMKDLQAELHIE
ncbi:MAG: hypothetical protein ACRD3E_12745 [Terriglobales bacterium]